MQKKERGEVHTFFVESATGAWQLCWVRAIQQFSDGFFKINVFD